MEVKKIAKLAIGLVIPLLLILFQNIIFQYINFATIYVNIRTLILEIIIIYSLFFIVTFISKSTFRTTLIFCIISFVFLIVNQIKLSYSGEPIFFNDIQFLVKINDLIKLVNWNTSIEITILPIIAMSIFYTIICILAYKLNEKIEKRNSKLYISILSVSILTIILLVIPSNRLKNFYLSTFYNINDRLDFASYVTNESYYFVNGVIAGMYGNMLENRITEPENYDEKELNEVLNSVNIEENEDWGTPNIIVVFSEAFWDIDQVEELKFDKPVTENFNKLKSEGIFVNMISPTYGGLSSNVEYELLTGHSNRYFNTGYIPFMQLYSSKKSEKYASIVKELANNGYETEIVYGKDYYSSEKVSYKLGFDKYTELTKTKENIKGYFLSDKYLTDRIIDRLKYKKDEEKVFYMIETIQNHMNFLPTKYENKDIKILNNNFSEISKGTLESYAQGVYDADKELGRLYEYIKSFDEPTVLLFLGDHLPYLYTEEKKNALFELDYFDSGDILRDYYRLYNTQGLILSNFEMKEKGTEKILSCNFLLNYIVNNIDIELSDYYRWLYTASEILPASNSIVSQDNNGNLYWTVKLDGEMKEMYDLQEKMQYRNLNVK